MAARALRFYSERLDELDERSEACGARVEHLRTQRMTTVASVQQSIELVQSHRPAIVIASSGMATGGRVLHHLAARLAQPEEHGVICRFPGGRHAWPAARATARSRYASRDGTFPSPRKLKRSIRCRRMPTPAEILRWLSGFSKPPSMTYLVHGEKVALDALSARIQQERQWPTHVAAYLERVEL